MMQKVLFDSEYIDDLEKQAEKKMFSDHTRSVFEEHQDFLEQKKRIVEEHKKWKKNRK